MNNKLTQLKLKKVAAQRRFWSIHSAIFGRQSHQKFLFLLRKQRAGVFSLQEDYWCEPKYEADANPGEGSHQPLALSK